MGFPTKAQSNQVRRVYQFRHIPAEISLWSPPPSFMLEPLNSSETDFYSKSVSASISYPSSFISVGEPGPIGNDSIVDVPPHSIWMEISQYTCLSPSHFPARFGILERWIFILLFFVLSPLFPNEIAGRSHYDLGGILSFPEDDPL